MTPCSVCQNLSPAATRKINIWKNALRVDECSTCHLLFDALQASGGDDVRVFTLTLSGYDRGILEAEDALYLAQLYCTGGTQ